MSNNEKSNGQYLITDNADGPNVQEEKKELTFIQFLRMYRIGQIPIMDLIFIYIMIYVANSLYFKCKYQWTLLMSIIFTIIIAIIVDRNFKMSIIIIIILIISIYLLVTNNYCTKKIE